MKDGSAHRNMVREAYLDENTGQRKSAVASLSSIVPREVDLTWVTEADGKGDTGGNRSPLDSMAALPLGDILDEATTTTATSEHQSPQRLQVAELIGASSRYGCFDELSEDELHGSSLYSVVRLKRSITPNRTGYTKRSRIPSTYNYPKFLWSFTYNCKAPAFFGKAARIVIAV